ncbi:hypothetical protein E2C01_059680 [Portunus trituberculatus]|uniref:Uncharacterized protein n=1 Tax=Portunus trituberculatus TaxID=210409 RepID=A0A5B7H611_PORTR|nr:hypothetical protein [Portunus trituberculatus]
MNEEEEEEEKISKVVVVVVSKEGEEMEEVVVKNFVVVVLNLLSNHGERRAMRGANRGGAEGQEAHKSRLMVIWRTLTLTKPACVCGGDL